MALTTLITSENFSLLENEIKDFCMEFGEAGAEIRTGIKIIFTTPVEFTGPDPAHPGRMLSHYELADNGTRLTDRGYSKYTHELRRFETRKDAYDLNVGKLSVYLVRLLSLQSKAALDTKAGVTGWAASKASMNTLRMWELIVEAHRTGSVRAQQLYLVKLLELKHTDLLSHEEFLSLFNRYVALVISKFASPADPTMISADKLFKSIYMNAVNPLFFAAQIRSFIDDSDEAETLSTLQDKLQRHWLAYGHSDAKAREDAKAKELLSTSFVSSALVASASAERVPLGPFDPDSGFCSHCWSSRYKKMHSLDDCVHYKTVLYKKDLLQKQKAAASPSTALVPAKMGKPVALFTGSVAPDDASERAFITDFESSIGRYRRAITKFGSSLYPEAQATLSAAHPDAFDD